MSKKASNVAKGIAIMMMLFHHLFYSADSIATNGLGQEVLFAPFTENSVIWVAQSFKICVSVYVFITAYGTFVQLSKRLDVADESRGELPKICTSYALEHVLKLLINFWIVYVIFALIGFAVSDHTLLSVYGAEGLYKGTFYFFSDIFGLAHMLGTPTFNVTWWYLSLAIMLIFILPVVTVAARKVGSVCLFAASIMVPLLAGFDITKNLWLYMPTAMLGIVAYQYDLFSKLVPPMKGPMTMRRAFQTLCTLVILFVLLCFFILARQNLNYDFLFNSICAFLVCLIACCLQHFSVVLDFLGKHSMNAFMMHTFIYYYYFGGFVFSFRWFIAIFAVLMGTSLIASICIELIKKFFRVNDLRDMLVASIRNPYGNRSVIAEFNR